MRALDHATKRSCAVDSVVRNAPEILFLAACSFFLAGITYCSAFWF
jgi:hypothetical protein